MKVNTMYTGFMGNSYGGAEEDNDMYAVTLKKGQSYKFICDADSYSEKTTIVKLLGKTTELSSFWPSVKKKISVWHPVMCLLHLIPEHIMLM